MLEKGFSNVSEASWNTIAYTARYITKKIKGKDAKIIYDSLGVEPEYLATSRRGGIGKPYYDKYWKEIYEKDQVIIHNTQGTIATQPPKYFDELYKKIIPGSLRESKKKD